MPKGLLLGLGVLLTGALVAAPKASEQHAKDMANGLALFKSDVRVVLKQHCVKCHGGDKTRSEFDLTTRAGLLKGGEEGVTVMPGKGKASRLYKLIAHLEKPHMPAKKPMLSSQNIAKIARWIDLGAPYDKPLIEKSIGGKGMQVLPDKAYDESLPHVGATSKHKIEQLAPRMDYAVNFASAGTYFVTIRCGSTSKYSGNSDSVHIGLNGISVTTASRYGIGKQRAWGWRDSTSLGRVKLEVPSAGIHTVNIFMREDGVKMDKIVVKKSAGNASGKGPAESPH